MPAIEDFDMRPTRALINSLMASDGDAETIFNGLHAALDRIETLEIEVGRLKIAAKNATQGSRNQPTECPCVFCERSHGEHEVFRDGYLAGLRGDDCDTNPHDDEPWNREAWDDGWKLGHAEWERYNPEPDEEDDYEECNP